MEQILKIPAILEDYKSAKKGSVSVKFITNENLTPEQHMMIVRSEDKFGHLIFLPTETEETELLNIINNLPALTKEVNEKTPSERMRAVLFIYWKEKCKDGKLFDEFYRHYMEQIIDQIKLKLNS
jgi:hypothetical protein